MKLRTILFLLPIVLSYGSGFSQKSNGQKLENAKTNSDYIDAIKIYEKVIEEDQLEDEDLFIKIASSYYFNSDYTNASRWFEKYYKINAIDPLPIYAYWYGQSLKAQGNYQKADSLLAPYYESKGEQYTYSDKVLENIRDNSDRYVMMPFNYNTENSDYPAYIHGDRLYFITDLSNGYQLGWRNKTTSDIQFVDDSIGEVRKPYGDLNSDFNEGSMVITKDGKTAYFTRNAFLNDRYKKTEKGQPRLISLNIYRAKLVDLGWENVTALSINSPNYSLGHPALSADEETLFFSSDMPGGKGGTDLYSVPIRKNGDLGKPVNLKALNSIGKEMFPFVDRETNNLYFSSDRSGTLGGLDVFVSPLEEGSYNVAYNIGKPINSSYDDFAYMINASKKGYFASNRVVEGEKEKLDEIYSFVETRPFYFSTTLAINGVTGDLETRALIPGVKLSLFDKEGKVRQTVFSDSAGRYAFAEEETGDIEYVQVEKKGYLTSEISLNFRELAKNNPKLNIILPPVLPNLTKAISIAGKVKDDNATKENTNIAEATIIAYTINGDILGVETTDESGAFSLDNLNRRAVAFVRIEKKGYLTKEVAINGNRVEGDIKYLIISLSPSRILKSEGEDIAAILNTIYFDFGRSEIREDAKKELEKIRQVLNEYKDVNIHIGSHTDSKGSQSYNQDLSQKRAKATYEYLIGRGIAPSRLSYKGYGESELLNKCSDSVSCTEEQDQLNRRSSFTIKK